MLRLRDCPVVSQLPLNKEWESYNMQWLELAPTMPKGVFYVLIISEAMVNPPIILSIVNISFLPKAAIKSPCPLLYEPITFVNM